MALSDITRKQARSDLRSRLNEYTDDKLSDGELNHWLNMGQFDVFNRLGVITEIWYGTVDLVNDVSGHTPGDVNLEALPSGAEATDMAKIVSIVGGTASDINAKVVPQVSLSTLYGYTHNSNWDDQFAFAHFGEWLYYFWGSGVTLTLGVVNIFFIRKPDEMASDSNVFTVTCASIVQNDTVTVDGILFTAKDAATTELADFVSTGSDTATGDNLEDVIGAIFTSATGVTSSNNAGVVTITGAKTVTSSNATRAAVATVTSSTVDVPTEFVDLVIMYALSKALGKLKMTQQKNEVDQDISERFNEINRMYATEIALRQQEQAPGQQTSRG